MSLASPIARSLEEQARSLVEFLAAHQHTLAEADAGRICSALPADAKQAAKQLRSVLTPLGIDIKHTHALKAVAVARDAEGFLGLGAGLRYDVASWAPDAPAVSAERKTFTSFAAAADEVCSRIRDQYEDDSPLVTLKCRRGYVLCSGASLKTGSWWRVVLAPVDSTGSPAQFEELQPIERLAERLRRLVEGELGGWLDGMFAIEQATSDEDEFALDVETRPESEWIHFLGFFKEESRPDDLPRVFPGVQNEEDRKVMLTLGKGPTQEQWEQFLKRYEFFARRHEEAIIPWVTGIRIVAGTARFEPARLDTGAFERARAAAGLEWTDIDEAFPFEDTEVLEGLRAGTLDLKHVPRLARFLKVDGNVLLAFERPTPRIPLPLHTDIGMWLSRMDVMVSEPEGAPRPPRDLAKRLQRICEVPYEQRRGWDKRPPAELEALNQELRFAGLVVCAGMGVRFVQDLPLGWQRPASVALFEFDRQVDVLTQGGQMGPHNGVMSIPPERDPVTPEWLARFNASKFTGKELLRYSDMVEQIREPDGDWQSRFHTQAYAGVKVFKRDPEKAHSASVRMEAMARLIEGRPLGPWVRTGRDDGSMMLSEAAFEAAARSPLIDVAGKPGFDLQTFYMLCVEHARMYA